VVKSNPLDSTQWTLVNKTGGSGNDSDLTGFGSSTFTFQTLLDTGGLLIYTFDTFAASTTVSLPNNQTIQETPQYLKFSFEVSHWDFLSASDKLQFVLSIQPAFNSTQIRPNSPQVGITTILLETIGTQQPDAVLRVLDYALAGPAFTQPVNCTVSTDTHGSLIFFTFDFFGNQTSLLYDPGTAFFPRALPIIFQSHA